MAETSSCCLATASSSHNSWSSAVYYMSYRKNHIRTALLIGAILLAGAPSPARGQQSNNSQSGNPQNNGNQPPAMPDTGLQPGPQSDAQSSQQDTQQNAPPAQTDVIEPVQLGAPPGIGDIRAIGTASPLSAFEGRWKWGPLYLGESDARAVYDSIRPTDAATSGIQASNNVLSLYSTSLILDKEWSRSRIAVQYQPRLAIAPGQVSFDYMNQNANFTTYFQLTPRWTMGIFDGFYYTNTDSMLGALYADADAVSLISVQNVVLDTSAKYLSDAGGVSFSYALTPRTYVSFSPGGGYTRTSGLSIANGSEISRTSLTFGASVRHIISPRTTIGFEYTDNYSQFTSNLPLSQYHSFGITYIHQFTATIGASILAGATLSTYSGEGSYWTSSGAISVFKSFRRASISAVYSRGQYLGGYVTNHIGDRADVLYRQRLSMRLGFTGSIGYQRELSGSTGAYGKYGEGEVNYELTPSTGLFADYVYKIQTGDTVQLFNGSRDFISAGIRWSPGVTGR